MKNVKLAVLILAATLTLATGCKKEDKVEDPIKEIAITDHPWFLNSAIRNTKDTIVNLTQEPFKNIKVGIDFGNLKPGFFTICGMPLNKDGSDFLKEIPAIIETIPAKTFAYCPLTDFIVTITNKTEGEIEFPLLPSPLKYITYSKLTEDSFNAEIIVTDEDDKDKIDTIRLEFVSDKKLNLQPIDTMKVSLDLGKIKDGK